MITLDEVKTYLKINDTSEDARLELIRQGIVESVKKYCGREFEYGTYTEDVYFRQGIGIVKETPVENISSITSTEGETLTVYKQLHGVIVLNESYTGWATVQYVAGYNVIPHDLKLALLRWCEYIYNKPEGVESQSFEGMNVRFTAPNDVRLILDKYRRVRV